MESEIPDILYLLTGNVVPNVNIFFKNDILLGVSVNDDAKDAIVHEICKLMQNEGIFNFNTEAGVNHTSIICPEQTSWTCQDVTITLLSKLFRLSMKGDVNTPKTLVVLDRPLDADKALTLASGLKEVEHKLNALDCYIKVGFVLLGGNTLHKI